MLLIKVDGNHASQNLKALNITSLHGDRSGCRRLVSLAPMLVLVAVAPMLALVAVAVGHPPPPQPPLVTVLNCRCENM